MADAKKESVSVFEELRDYLFRDAAELVSDVPSTNIAIFVTPPPGYEKDIATCSFGHPSAEAVFNNFLEEEAKAKGKAIEEDEEEKEDLSSPRGWWNDSTMLQSMTMEHLLAVRDQLTTLKNQLILEQAKSMPDASSENPDDQPNH